MARIRGIWFAGLTVAALGGGGAATESAQAQSSGSAALALTGARLIDGTGAQAIENATLLIRDGRVAAVGAAGAIDVPSGATRVDLSGKTIVPGFVNAHGHLNDGDPSQSRRDRLISQLRLYADYGVTTVVVLGAGEGDLDETVRLRREQDRSPLDRARVFVAGPSIQREQSAAAARATVNAYADADADIVKIHITGADGDTPPAVYQALIDQAHQRGLRVAAHLYYLEDAHGLLDANVDVIAHSVRDQDVDRALIDKIKARNVAYIPTLTRDLARFVYESTPDFFSDPFWLRKESAYRADMTLVRATAYQQDIRESAARQDDKRGLAQGMRNLKTLADAGVLVGMGTDTGTNDGQWQGYFEHVELAMMVDAGMSPAQVITAATGNAARTIGLEDQLGTLVPGRWADLVVLNANPLDDIRATRDIDSVWIAGTRLSRDD